MCVYTVKIYSAESLKIRNEQGVHTGVTAEGKKLIRDKSIKIKLKYARMFIVVRDWFEDEVDDLESQECEALAGASQTTDAEQEVLEAPGMPIPHHTLIELKNYCEGWIDNGPSEWFRV